MIDTHCHLTYPGLHERADEVVAAARAAGVDRMITIATTLAEAPRAVALAERHEGVFAAVGVHPHEARQGVDTAALRAWLDHPKVVALGEMGLDRHHPTPTLDEQRPILIAQLDVAAACDVPIIIHNRLATDDTLDVLRRSGLAPSRFVFHCFTGSRAELEAILDFGAMVSLTGIVTFNSARELAASSDRIPLHRLMVETDAPYLTPVPHRKVATNEPKYVVEVARFLAARRGMPLIDFERETDSNAERFFKLPN